MALNTGKKIVRRCWDVITIPDIVITRVNTLGSNQLKQLIFASRRGHNISDVGIPGVDPSDVDHIKIPGVDALYINIDNIKIPGVDVDIQETQVIEIVDPNIQQKNISPIEPAPGSCDSRADAVHTKGGA